MRFLMLTGIQISDTNAKAWPKSSWAIILNTTGIAALRLGAGALHTIGVRAAESTRNAQ